MVCERSKEELSKHAPSVQVRWVRQWVTSKLHGLQFQLGAVGEAVAQLGPEEVAEVDGGHRRQISGGGGVVSDLLALLAGHTSNLPFLIWGRWRVPFF